LPRIAELIEFLAGSAGAKKAGGSPPSAGERSICGLVGAIGCYEYPFPIIGTNDMD